MPGSACWKLQFRGGSVGCVIRSVNASAGQGCRTSHTLYVLTYWILMSLVIGYRGNSAAYPAGAGIWILLMH